MYENKISTATLGGHGFGGKLALATGCYHQERVSGVFGLDSAPVDHRFFESFREMKDYVNKAYFMNLNRSRKEIENELKEAIPDPKWRRIMS
jgi:pimeloyl-ACP methyl ester carboxylesterase